MPNSHLGLRLGAPFSSSATLSLLSLRRSMKQSNYEPGGFISLLAAAGGCGGKEEEEEGGVMKAQGKAPLHLPDCPQGRRRRRRGDICKEDPEQSGGKSVQRSPSSGN